MEKVIKVESGVCTKAVADREGVLKLLVMLYIQDLTLTPTLGSSPVTTRSHEKS